MASAAPNELPSWLDDNDDEETLTFNHSTKKVEPVSTKRSGNNAPAVAQTDLEKKKKWVFWGFKISTIAMCCLMYVTAVLSMSRADSITYSGKVMTAVYMIMFTSVLVVFEVAELQQVVAIEHFYRRNFGFLFNAKGKSLFIIFIAFLSFGLGEPELLCITTGLAWIALGGGEMTVYLKFPELFEAVA